MKRILKGILLLSFICCAALSMCSCESSDDGICDNPSCEKAAYPKDGDVELCSDHYLATDNEASQDALVLVLVVIFVCFFALVINYVVAKKMEQVAVLKGYSRGSGVFLICFFLGIIGYIYVATLPDLVLRREIERLSAIQSIEK